MKYPLKKYRISSSFKDHLKVGGARAKYAGDDLVPVGEPTIGTNLWTPESGTLKNFWEVVKVGNKTYRGRGTFLTSKDKKRRWSFAHMSAWIKKGEVSENRAFAKTGDSGYVTGAHTHVGLEILQNGKWVRVSPIEYLKKNKAGVPGVPVKPKVVKPVEKPAISPEVAKDLNDALDKEYAKEQTEIETLKEEIIKLKEEKSNQKQMYETLIGNYDSKHREEVKNLQALIERYSETEAKLTEDNKVLESANYSLRKKRKVIGLDAYESGQLENELIKRKYQSWRMSFLKSLESIVKTIKREVKK